MDSALGNVLSCRFFLLFKFDLGLAFGAPAKDQGRDGQPNAPVQAETIRCNSPEEGL